MFRAFQLYSLSHSGFSPQMTRSLSRRMCQQDKLGIVSPCFVFFAPHEQKARRKNVGRWRGSESCTSCCGDGAQGRLRWLQPRPGDASFTIMKQTRAPPIGGNSESSSAMTLGSRPSLHRASFRCSLKTRECTAALHLLHQGVCLEATVAFDFARVVRCLWMPYSSRKKS